MYAFGTSIMEIYYTFYLTLKGLQKNLIIIIFRNVFNNYCKIQEIPYSSIVQHAIYFQFVGIIFYLNLIITLLFLLLSSKLMEIFG